MPSPHSGSVKIQFPEKRTTRKAEFATGRNEYFSVYCWPFTRLGMFSQMAESRVKPAAVETTCRLPLPRCLTEVLMEEPARLGETVQGGESVDSKSPLSTRFALVSALVPAASLMSST